MQSRKKSDPIDTMVECIVDFNEAQFEDSDVSDEELELAKRRFKSALQFLIITTMEQYDEKKQIQSHTSA